MSLKPQWYYILLSLAVAHRHGLAVARDVQQLSSGGVKLWPATLYGSLQELADLGWITEIEGADDRPAESERKRFYGITPSGRQILDAETRRLAELVRHARAVARRQNA